MSAILGVLSLDSAIIIRQDMLEDGMNTIRDYGPDGSHTWTDGVVGLGVHLLHVSPESADEQQPLMLDGSVIVADATLFNRTELFRELAISRAEQSGIVDSRLILLAFQKWGEACTEHLIGDFTFAIWDTRQRFRFCARDHAGIRPFYYTVNNRRFAFCTDIRGILPVSGVRQEIDEEQAAAYLYNPNGHPLVHTFFRDIYKLPPAHQLLMSGGLRLSRYWQPDAAGTLHLKSEHEYRERLEELLNTAIRSRLDTPFPVASHNSGGIDSGIISVLAERLLRESGRHLATTYSWSPAVSEAFPMLSDDERLRLQAMCTPHSIPIYYAGNSSEAEKQRLSGGLALEPSSFLPVEPDTLRHARENGIRVILSGWGGDQTVSFKGLGYETELLMRGRWGHLLGHIKRNAKLRPKPILQFVNRNVVAPFLPDSAYGLLVKRTGTVFDPPLIRRDFDQRYPLARHMNKPLRRSYPGLQRNQEQIWNNGHLSGRAEGWAVCSAPYQVIYRYPMLDPRLAEFAFQLPYDFVVRNNWSCYLLRKFASDVLGPDLAWANLKRDPSVEQLRRHNRHSVWKTLLSEVEQGQWNDDAVPWLDMQRLRDAIREFPAQPEDMDVSRYIQITTAVEVYYLWLYSLKCKSAESKASVSL